MSVQVIDRDLGWKEIVRETKKISGDSVKAGELQDAKYPDGTHIPDILYYHEYGTDIHRARHPMRSSFQKNISTYQEVSAEAYTEDQDLSEIGEEMESDIKSAIELKGLIDTGMMRDKVSHTEGEPL